MNPYKDTCLPTATRFYFLYISTKRIFNSVVKQERWKIWADHEVALIRNGSEF